MLEIFENQTSTEWSNSIFNYLNFGDLMIIYYNSVNLYI